MSLINKVLRNLDDQNQQVPAAASAAQYQGLSPVRESRHWLRLAFAGVLVMGLAAYATRTLLELTSRTAPVVALSGNPGPAVAIAPVGPPPGEAGASSAPPVVPPVPARVEEAAIVPPPVAVPQATVNPAKAGPAALPMPAVAAGEAAAKTVPQPKEASETRNPVQPESAPPAEVKAAATEHLPAPRVAGKGRAIKQTTLTQRSENLYREALVLDQQGDAVAAEKNLRDALALNADFREARDLLAALLTDAGRTQEAAALLRENLAHDARRRDSAMALARIQQSQGDTEAAVATLRLAAAGAGEDGEFQAYLAGLLQRQGRHAEAIQHYLAALRTDPSRPVWLVGAGISLRAENQQRDATEAFQRALESGELAPELSQFAEQQLKQLRGAGAASE